MALAPQDPTMAALRVYHVLDTWKPGSQWFLSDHEKATYSGLLASLRMERSDATNGARKQ